MRIRRIFEPKSCESIVTIPNFITFLGITAVGFYTYGFLTNSRWLLGIMLFLAGLSDLFDGIAARRLKQRTRLGEFIDPLRDRFLLVAVLVNILYVAGIKYIFLVGLIVVYEISTAVCNLVLLLSQKRKVHLVGKLRQAAHLLLAGLVILSFYFRDIIFCIVSINFNFPPGLALMLMAFFSCVALLIYVFSAISIRFGD